jgi:hypothetical protein
MKGQTYIELNLARSYILCHTLALPFLRPWLGQICIISQVVLF